MARESGAGAPQRRASSGLDPSRSSVRRVSTRRTSPSRPPPVARRDPPAVPRNQRVKAREPTGPTLGVRMWTIVFTRARVAQARLTTIASALAGKYGARIGSVRTLVGFAAVLAFFVGMGYLVHRHLTTAPAFAIDAIEIKGLTRLDRAELLRAAGIDVGKNIFEKSPGEVRASLLVHPWIVGAEVSRTLPSRLQITIRERDPVSIMLVEACGPPPTRTAPGGDDEPGCDEASSMYLVSGEGKLFKRVGHKDPVDLPVITGLTRARYTEDPELSRRLVVDALALLAEYRSSGLWQRSPIGEIHVEVNDGLSLYVGEDLTYVRLGVPPYTQKLRRMKKVLERLEREHARAEYIYLDNEQHPDRVAVRVR